MVAIIGTIASGLSLATVGTMIWYGFLMLISYKSVDVVGDFVHTYTISKEAELERNKRIDDAVEDMCDEKNLSAEERFKIYNEIENARKGEKGDIFDQISRSLGITKETLIWVIVGILAFSMLKG